MKRTIIKKFLPKLRLTSLGSLNAANEQIKALLNTVEFLEAGGGLTPGQAQPLLAMEKRLVRDRIALKWEILDTLDQIRFSDDHTLACRICGHSALKGTYEQITSRCAFGGGVLIRFICPNCGCIFGPLKILNMDPLELSEEYKRHYYVYTEGDSTELELRAFNSLKPTKSGKYLNFGCGSWSKTIDYLRDDGYDIWGYEPFAPSQSPFILNDFMEVEGQKYDGIFTNNLIEHLQDPIAHFEALKPLLRNSKVLVAHSTACYEYAYEFTRFHLFFFTGNAVDVICQRTGYRVIRSESDPGKGYINLVFSLEDDITSI